MYKVGEKMTMYCANCKKELKVWDNVYAKMQLPKKGFTELQAYLSLNAKVYCENCIKIVEK